MGYVEYRREGRIAYLTLNRPERHNAMRDEDVLEFNAAMERFDGDEEAFVAIVSGSGASFCSGADVAGRLAECVGQGVSSHYRPSLETVFYRAVNFKPVIAGVHGYALGKGMSLAMHCDLLVAAEDARFQLTEIVRGVPANAYYGLLSRVEFDAFATEMALTGRRWSAAEGLEHGLVNRVVPSGAHLREARAGGGSAEQPAACRALGGAVPPGTPGATGRRGKGGGRLLSLGPDRGLPREHPRLPREAGSCVQGSMTPYGDRGESTLSFGRRLAELAAAQPDAVSVVEVSGEGTERTLSWGELDDLSLRLATTLRDDGLGYGDMVAVCLPNCAAHLVASAAAWKLGAVPVSVRWDLPDWELQRVLGVLCPRLVLAGDPEAVLDRAAARPDDLEDLVSPHRFGVCSSGSTGTPKVVLHSSPAVDRPSQRVTSAVVEAYRTISAPQTLLVPNALYHSSSITTVTLNLMAAGRTVLLGRFDASRLLDVVARHRVTGFMAPTPILLRLARYPDISAEAFESVEWVQHGAAPLPEWLAQFWISFLGGERFFTSYGSAEGVGLVACRGDEWLQHPGTLGRGVLGTELAIFDDAGRRLPPHQVGNIHTRRPGGPAGTYVGEAVNPLEVRPDGFATVGDLGWTDDEGYLYLADRRVDLIVSGGANVYPAEVEAAVGEHPAVADVVVIGLPDEEWGRRVHAIVQPTAPAAVTPEAIREFARKRLARYKVPKTVEMVDRIPRSAAMKVNRTRLVEERTTGG